VARTIAKDHDLKRAQILKSAAKVFADAGYDRASMTQLARECGIEIPETGGRAVSRPVILDTDLGSDVDDAIAMIREVADELDEIHNVYVTDRDRRLRGVISLRTLVLAQRGTRVSDVMEHDVVTVSTDMDQEDVAEVFRKYDLVALVSAALEGDRIAETIADPHTLSVWPAAADRTAPFWSSAPMARASTEPEPAAAPSPKV